MFKEGTCPNCRWNLKVPENEFLILCNRCKKIIIFLCHVIRAFATPLDIQCGKCPLNYALLSCHKCEGTMAIRDFKAGHPYRCGCGAKTAFIFCTKCRAVLAISGKHDYQKSLIACKKCDNKMRFKICDACRTAITYKQEWDKSDTYICSDSRCKGSEQKNPYGDVSRMNIPPPSSNYNSPRIENNGYSQKMRKEQQHQHLEKGEYAKNPYLPRDMNEKVFPSLKIEQKNPYGTSNMQGTKNISKTKILDEDKELCKICFVNESCMINTKCYHLSVCQPCSADMKNVCPICRSEGGEYKKVYKS